MDRGGEIAGEILGEDYAGILCRDGWGGYNAFSRAQTCLAHLLRRSNEIIAIADRGAARFPHGIQTS